MIAHIIEKLVNSMMNFMWSQQLHITSRQSWHQVTIQDIEWNQIKIKRILWMLQMIEIKFCCFLEIFLFSWKYSLNATIWKKHVKNFLVVIRKPHFIALFKILDWTSPHFCPFSAALLPHFLGTFFCHTLPHFLPFRSEEKCGTTLFGIFTALKHCPWQE